MIGLDVRAALKKFDKDMDALQRKQIPFANAMALTSTARIVAKAESAGMEEAFSSPTPFTVKGVAVIPATKSSQTATVFIKDKQAAYLAPEIDGGKQVLGSKRAILTPIEIGVNQYGNLPRNKIAQLKGKSNVFVGAVHFKSGAVINGVWQRPKRGKQRKAKGMRRAGPVGTKGNTAEMAGVRTGLKLLVRFTDPVTVKTKFDYYGIGIATAKAVWPGEFQTAMVKAMATAR